MKLSIQSLVALTTTSVLIACSGQMGALGESEQSRDEPSGDTEQADTRSSDPSGEPVPDTLADGEPASGDTTEPQATAQPGDEAAAAAQTADDASGSETPSASPDAAVALRRLSRRELENTLSDVFAVSGLAETYLSADILDPFDTSTSTKQASLVYIEGIEDLAFELGQRVSENTEWVDEQSGCSPSGATDAECMTRLVASLGRRAYRRPLTEDEVSAATSTAIDFATGSDDFYVGVRWLVMSLAQSPHFLYRTEIGVPAEQDESLRLLDNYEVASRLSYLIWGSAPSVSLLDRAEMPMTSDELAELAQTMIEDPRFDAQMATFHRLWFGYDELRVPSELMDSMRAETNAVLERVLVTDRSPWSTLFNLKETYVDAALAEHYGMPTDAAPGWVSYDNPERSGLLAHGSILSLAARNTVDTSPTIRGKYIANRLLCREVPPPPPNVAANDPPEAGADECKSDAYAAHRDKSTACFSCHDLIDPIGFGLERFDGLGRYRTTEPQNENCSISGDGELKGVGTFNGPAELAQLMQDSGELTHCAAEQLFDFSMGRQAQPGESELVDRLNTRFTDSGEDFRQMVQALVLEPSFVQRVEE